MKVTIVGAGNVGATLAFDIANKGIADKICLVDIKYGLSEGKALDISQTAPINYFDSRIIGCTDCYDQTADSDVVVITSGVPRKPGMSRDDLIHTNAIIVKNVTENIIKYSPNAIIIIVANPLDVMTYVANKVTKINRNKVIGMAGILDTARFRTFIAEELNCSPKDVQALLLGGHGDTMVPLPRYTNVGGIPITQLISKERLDEIIKRTQNGGGEIVNLLHTSAYYAPAAATAQMVEAIICNQRRLVPCCTLLNGEYGLDDICVGVPVILGKNGVEQIIEIELNKEERQLFDVSANAVRSMIQVLKNFNII